MSADEKRYHHEKNRILSMTDDQLQVRYGKMLKEDKIEMFYEVLQEEDRHVSLQKEIAHDMGYEWKSSVVPTDEDILADEYGDPNDADADAEPSWVLRHPSEDKEYVFVAFGTKMRIEFWKNGGVINEEPPIPAVDARERWASIVKDDGYAPLQIA